MATLTARLTLESTDATSDALSLSVTDSLTIVSPLVNISKITATTTGGDSIIVPNLDSPRYVYLKHMGLNSAGSSSGTDKVVVETADGTQIIELKIGEFAFFPWDCTADIIYDANGDYSAALETWIFVRTGTA